MISPTNSSVIVGTSGNIVGEAIETVVEEGIVNVEIGGVMTAACIVEASMNIDIGSKNLILRVLRQMGA